MHLYILILFISVLFQPPHCFGIHPFAIEHVELKENREKFLAIIKQYEDELKQSPQNRKLTLAIADVYYSIREYDQAATYYRKVLEVDPENIAIKISLAQSYLNYGQIKQSEQLFQEIAQKDPNHLIVISSLGRIAALEHRDAEAEELYQKALKTSPNDLNTLYYLAEFRLAKKRYLEAQNILKELIKKQPGSPWMIRSLQKAELGPMLETARKLEQQKELNAAAALYKKEMANHSNIPDLYIAFASFYLRQHNPLEAIKIIKQGLNLYPDDRGLLLTLGFGYLANHEIDDAKIIFEKESQSKDLQSEAFTGLGRIAAFHGDWEKAEHLFELARERNPLDTTPLYDLAQLRIDQKRYKEARQLLESITKIDPEQVESVKSLIEEAELAPMIEAAIDAEKAHKFKEAEQKYQEMIAKYPHHLSNYIRLGRFYRLQKDEQKEIETYLNGLNAGPQSVDLQVALGYAYLSKMDFNSAQERFKKALDLHPLNAEALVGVARLRSLKGEKKAAEDLYQEILLAHPNNETALSFLADLKSENHEFQEAQLLYSRILKINPTADWAQQSLLKIQYADQFNAINTFEKSGNIEKAIQKGEDLVEKIPKSVEAYLTLGRLYTIKKQHKKLIYLYQKALSHNPQSYQLRVNLGLAYLNLHQIEQAEECFEFVLKQDPANDEAMAGLARVAVLKNNPSLAERLYNTALTINPKSLLTLSYLGEFYLKQKEYAKAQGVYKKILKILPDAPWANIGLEEAQYGPLLKTIKDKEGTQDFHAAEALYLKLIAESSQSIKYSIQLGQLYIKTHRPQKALSVYHHALKKDPHSLDLQTALGFAYLANKELKKGQQLFKKVLKLSAKQAEAIAGLGRVAQLSDDPIHAKLRYNEAIKIDPHNITARSDLAQLLYKEGDYRLAKKHFKKILSLNPDALWVKQAIKDATWGKLLKEIENKEEANELIGAAILWEQLLLEEPKDSDYYLRAGLFYHRIKEYQKAINTYFKGLTIKKNSPELYAALGLTYLSEKKWAEARKAFQKALKEDPKNPDALAGLAHLALIKGDVSKGENLIQKALSIDPERIAALSVLGDLYMKEHRYKEAEKTYKKIHELRPKEKWIVLELDDAKYGEILEHINALVENEQFSEAAEQYGNLLKESPDNPNYYFGLGQMYIRLKQYGLSIQINQEGLDKNPDANALRIALGYAYFFNNQLNKARQTLNQAIEIDLNNPEALAGLGRVNALENNPCLAESLYRQALEIDPKNLSALSFMADLLIKEKRYSEAQETLTILWQILPNAKWVIHSWEDARDGPIADIARRYANREDFELAAGLYEQLVKSAPDAPDRYLPLGQMYVNMQKYCTGIQIYEEGLSIDPEASSLWRGIAFAYLFMENYTSAQQIFAYLVDEDPDDAESWAGLGRIKALRGDLCSAEQDYFTALAIKPDNLIALSFLADLREVEGYPFSALENDELILGAAIDPFDETRQIPKWARRAYHHALNLTQPTLQIVGSYHEEDQWTPVIDKWSAKYLVYGETALLNYPIYDALTLWGSGTEKFYVLKDQLTHSTIYSFDVQKARIAAKWVFRRCFSLEAIIGFTYFSPYSYGTFKMRHGTIAEPCVILSYNGPTQKALLSFTTDSDLVARDFKTNTAKLVCYYQINGAYSRKLFTRAWAGIDCNATWYRDFVNNTSQKALGWFQWRPPIYSDHINFRYFVKYQTFAKNIPDYYTYKPQIINQLQVSLEKSWRVCWAETFYTSFTYGHGWQNTRTRFRQIIVVAPTPAPLPMGWDNRQYDTVLGNILYKFGRLQCGLTADYYRDTQKYTMWTIGGDLTWRF